MATTTAIMTSLFTRRAPNVLGRAAATASRTATSCAWGDRMSVKTGTAGLASVAAEHPLAAAARMPGPNNADANPMLQHFSVRPLTSGLGAEVVGVDLTRPLPPPVVDELLAAYSFFSLLVFRDLPRPLPLAAHVDFASTFGAPEPHPIVAGLPDAPEVLEIVKEAGEVTRFGETWHSDNSYMARPTSASILHGAEVPPWGNDTAFASMYLAYEALSPALQRVLDGLGAVHTAGVAFSPAPERAEQFAGDGPMKYDLDAVVAGGDGVVHPVVRTHPVTGRRGLFVNSMFTTRFDGMTEEESRPLLEFLFAHVTKPQFHARVPWVPNQVAVWDNRCTQHMAIDDSAGAHRRVMRRVSCVGEKPL